MSKETEEESEEIPLKAKAFFKVIYFLNVHRVCIVKAWNLRKDRDFSTRLAEIRCSLASRNWGRSHSCFMKPSGTSQISFRLNERRGLLQVVILRQIP